MDSHLLARVSQRTLDIYRKEGRAFAAWLRELGVEPFALDEWDDMAVEYKNAVDLTKSRFAHLIACIEFFFVRFRGELKLARAVADGWEVSHETRHTVPLGRRAAALLGVHLACGGWFRLAAGLQLQVRLGLRPSEMLKLMAGDVQFLSAASGGAVANDMLIRLGRKTGTKAKREQYAILRAGRDDDVVLLIRRLRDETATDERMFPFTLHVYGSKLKEVQASLGGSLGWTPHSPRAGFATDRIAAGAHFNDVKEEGRWISESSFRRYIDIVTAHSLDTELRARGLVPAALEAERRLNEFFPAGCFYGAEGLESGRRGVVAAGVLPGADATTRHAAAADGEAPLRSRGRFAHGDGGDDGRGSVWEFRPSGRLGGSRA